MLPKVMEIKDEFFSLIPYKFKTLLNAMDTATQVMNYTYEKLCRMI